MFEITGISFANNEGVKYFSLFILILLLMTRLSRWAADRENLARHCSQLLSIRKERVATIYRGIFAKNSNGKLQLSNMEFEKNGLYEPLLAVVGLEFLIKNRDPLFGQDVLVSGSSRCIPAFRNPARMKDFIYLFQRSKISISIKKLVSPQLKRFDFSFLRAIAGFVAYLSQQFTLHLEQVFKGYPGLLAFELAVWTGNTEGLPTFFKTFYKEGGLLQVLALSGQHVAAMVLVFGFFLRMGFKFLFRSFENSFIRGIYKYIRRFFPLACCLVLYITSHQNPTVIRTLAMVFSLLILRLRKLSVSTLQIVLSSVAILIILDPSLIASVGFFLSVIATGLLVRVGELSQREAFKRYLSISLVMPVLVFPLSAFFFSKVALISPLTQILIGWIWDIFLIPFGFIFPLLLKVLPHTFQQVLLTLFEKYWNFFCGVHVSFIDYAAASYHSAIRPDLVEVFIVEFCLLTIALSALRYLLVEDSSTD